jgi:hypothetical protein
LPDRILMPGLLARDSLQPLTRSSTDEGSVRSRAKIRQNHNGWYLMDVEESLYLVGWRET